MVAPKPGRPKRFVPKVRTEVHSETPGKNDDTWRTPPKGHNGSALVRLVVDPAHEDFGVEDPPLRFCLNLVQCGLVSRPRAERRFYTRKLLVKEPYVAVEPKRAGPIVAGFVLVSGAPGCWRVERCTKVR